MNQSSISLEVDRLATKKDSSQIAAALNNLKFLARPHVIAAIFLVLYGVFFAMQYQQGREQEKVSAELAKTQKILRKVPQDRLELDDRLVSAQKALILERETFPPQQPTNVLLDSILQMASESGIQVLNTKLIALREDTIEQIKYVVSPFDVQARGSMSQIASFLRLLEEGPLPTILIGGVNLSKGDTDFSMGVRFNVYGRAPISDNTLPASQARELPTFEIDQGGVRANVSYVAWDETGLDQAEYSGVKYVELYYRADNQTQYSKYTTLDNPTGQWTQSPISFAVSSGTAFELYTIAVDQAGNREEPPVTGADVAFTVEAKS